MSYSIDGASAETANIPGSPSTAAPALFNQYLFHSAVLPAEDHVLEVVYNGNSSQSAPLVLDYFLVLNRTSEITSTATAAAQASSSVNKYNGTYQAGAPPHLQNISEKVGIAVGASMAFIVLTILIFIVHRRRGNFGHNAWYNWTYRYPLYDDGRD